VVEVCLFLNLFYNFLYDMFLICELWQIQVKRDLYSEQLSCHFINLANMHEFVFGMFCGGQGLSVCMGLSLVCLLLISLSLNSARKYL
jgi:hypothetical protein